MASLMEKASNAISGAIPKVMMEKIVLSNEKIDNTISNINVAHTNIYKPSVEGQNTNQIIKVDLIASFNIPEFFFSKNNKATYKIYIQEFINDKSNIQVKEIENTYTYKDFKMQNGKYVFKHQSQIPSSNPNYLAYSCWLETVDKEVVNVQDYDVTAMSGERSMEIVISSGKVPKYISYEKNTTINGTRRHYHILELDSNNNGYAKMGGPYNVDHQHRIVNGRVQAAKNHVHQIIPTTYIVDNRVFDDIKTEQKQLSNNDTLVQQKVVKKDNQQIIKTKDPLNAFSDLWISNNKDGSNSFSFAFDVQKVIEENSLFKNLYKNNPLMLQELSTDKPVIREMKIFRKRIKGSPDNLAAPSVKTSGNYLNYVFGKGYNLKNNRGFTKLDNDKPDELVMICSEDRSSYKILPKKYDKDIFDNNLKNNSIEELSLLSYERPNTRFFGITDRSFLNKTDGFYSYRLEAKVYDPILNILNRHLTELDDAVKVFQEYYEYAVGSPGFSRNPFGNIHTNNDDTYYQNKDVKSPKQSKNFVASSDKSDSYKQLGGKLKGKVSNSLIKKGQMAKSFEKGEFVPKNYDVKRDTFTKSFDNKLFYGSSESVDGLGVSLKESLDNYLTVLSVHNGTTNGLADKRNSISNAISPKSGNPSGIQALIDSINFLREKIKSYINLYNKTGFNKDDGLASATTKKSPIQEGTREKNSIISVDYNFSETFSADIMINNYFDFMGLKDSDTFSYKKVSRADLERVFELEVKKTLNASDSDLSIQNFTPNDTANTSKYSYVTPTVLKSSAEIDLRNSVNSVSMGTDLAFNKIAISSFVTNKGVKKSSTKAESANVVDRFNPLTSNAIKKVVGKKYKPLNTIEENLMTDEPSLMDNIKISEQLADFLGLDCVKVVDVVNSGKADKPNFVNVVTSSICSDEEIDAETKNKNYINDDLGYGSDQESKRTAQPLLFSILKNSKQYPDVSSFNLTSGVSKIKREFDGWKNKKKSPSSYIKNAPNQVKVLLKYNEREASNNSTPPLRDEVYEILNRGVTNDNRNSYRYKFETINRVEVLTSFDQLFSSKQPQTIDEKKKLNLPMWETLTSDILTRYRGKDLLARIVPYEDKTFGIERDKDYELPTIDGYFIIKGE